MIVNCGFEQKIKNKRGRVAYKYKNVQNIKVPNGLLPSQLRSMLMDYAPEGDGWSITGYFVKKETE